MAAKFDQPEHRLSHYVDSLLDRIILTDGPHWWTAVETGTIMLNKSAYARMNWEQKRRARGIKPAHLDWYLYQAPLFTQFELKYEDAPTRDKQLDTITALIRCGVQTAVCRSVLDVYQFVQATGFRLHGNAANIAALTDMQWRAADEAARGPVAAPKKRRASARSAYPTRPSKAALARGARMAAVRP